jgi:hypothetical protein
VKKVPSLRVSWMAPFLKQISDCQLLEKHSALQNSSNKTERQLFIYLLAAYFMTPFSREFQNK